MDNWQPIETAPKDGSHIITLVKGFRPTVGWWDGKEWTNRSESSFRPDMASALLHSRRRRWLPSNSLDAIT